MSYPPPLRDEGAIAPAMVTSCPGVDAWSFMMGEIRANSPVSNSP
jgi:hypothetical protein